MRNRQLSWLRTDTGRRCLIALMAIGLLLPAELVHAPQPAAAAAADTVHQGNLSAARMLPVARAVLRAAAEAKGYAAAPPALSGSQGPIGPTDEVSTTGSAPPVTTYIVRPGDTLSGIAARFGTDVASLEASNNLTDSSVIQPGQHLIVPTQVGWMLSVAPGDTLSQIAAQVGLTPAAIAAANHINVNGVLGIGQHLWIPHDPPASATQGPAASSGGGSYGAAVGTGSMPWPVRGPITSPFGWRILYGRPNFHDGLDIGVPMYTPVHASISGRVITAGWDGPFGIAVRIENGNVITLYAHNSRVVVSVGQSVQVGQLISYSGMTGNATGPHVHFGVYINGKAMNPIYYLQP